MQAEAAAQVAKLVTARVRRSCDLQSPPAPACALGSLSISARLSKADSRGLNPSAQLDRREDASPASAAVWTHPEPAGGQDLGQASGTWSCPDRPGLR